MGAASHLGIRLRDYDRKIRSFIPRYEEMLDAAATSLAALSPNGPPLIVDLGTGSGALAERCVGVIRGARVIGIDADPGMLAFARRRLGDRLTAVTGDFLTAPIPRCDAVIASFALHHVRTTRVKARLYERAFRALRRGGLLVNADCCIASNDGLRARDRRAWRAHLERRYTRARAESYLRAWAAEDVYLPLSEELGLLREAGFAVDVPWRRDAFAVIVAVKGARRVTRA